MSRAGSRSWAALALQLAALAALCWALLGHAWLDARSKPRLLVLLDRSDSVPRGAADQALADALRSARAAGSGDVQVIEFAAMPAAPAARAAEPGAAIDPSATDIEAALNAALAVHAERAVDGVLVISDGHENAGDAARALRALRDARLPLQWLAVGRPPPLVRVAQVLAPARARVGQPVQISVQLAGQLDRALRIQASARTAGGQSQSASAVAAAGEARVTLEFDTSRSGVFLVDVALQDADSGATLDALPDAAVIDVAPPATILFAQGSGGPLASSLLRGGWALETVPATRLDALADRLDGYQAIVLDDVAVTDAGPRFWDALVAAVRQRGLGLLVLAGERSFARGGYRGSVLESVLPLASEPAALDQPASIVFAVDKSGSMGRGSGGVDRFALAQRAVLETARGLAARDALGLLVFDVVPRVLIPLGPAAEGVAALERRWPVSPNGGTKLAPAIAAAVDELERSGDTRRMLVIVTDGFADDVPPAALQARLARARIETIALAVGPDADAGGLQRLIGAERGQVLRVAEAAELPQVMRSGIERRRARVERGSIAVEQPLALPFAPGVLQGWPPVAAHAVTRPQAQAVVAVQSRRGEPLIAYQTAGRGRVVAVACGLGPWSPQWLAWREWPRLAGGLADWVSSSSHPGAVALTVTDLPDGLAVEAELPSSSAGAALPGVSIVVDTPTTQGRPLATEQLAPGRVRALLPEAPAGLYTFVVSTASGTERHLHLRQRRAESVVWGTSAALAAWRAAGLVADWDAGLAVQRRGAGPRPLDRSLIGLALVLFLAGVLVDRAAWRQPDVKAAWQRWRRRG